jgi:hypothetical protein
VLFVFLDFVNGGWQWVAGTQPFFRIFNPVARGERFDPNGEYVRRSMCRNASEFRRPSWTIKVQRARALRIYRQEQPGVEANSSINRSGSDGAATRERPDQE